MFNTKDGNIVTEIYIYEIKVNFFIDLSIFSYYYYNIIHKYSSYKI